MVRIRFGIGVAMYAIAGLLVRAAVPRLIGALARMFAGAVAFAIGVVLVGSGVWSALRRWRRGRAAVEEVTQIAA